MARGSTLQVSWQFLALPPCGGADSDLIRALRMWIGSSTGYTRALMEAVIPKAREQGYSPDVVLCSDEVPSGRPMPWLNFRACEALGVYPPASVLVVDDTPIGIQVHLMPFEFYYPKASQQETCFRAFQFNCKPCSTRRISKRHGLPLKAYSTRS